MTATVSRTFSILDHEFDVDQLLDIVNHGMSAGVSGFIYTRECVDKFDENDDEIQDYLSDWVYDNLGDDESSFKYFAPDCEDISQLKNKLVWSYVELKAFEILSENNIEFWFFIHSNCSLRLFMFSVLIYDEFYDSGDSPSVDGWVWYS